MMSGLAQILMSPAQLTKDYFEIGSVSGTFLNVSLVGFVCAAMTCLPGAAVGGGTIAAYFLTTGFSFWGINFLNMWPFFLGVMVHALVRKEPFPKYVNLAMFLACAVLIPETVIRLFFIIPVKMKWVAWADLLLLAYDILMIGCLPLIFYTPWVYGDIPQHFLRPAG